MRKKIQNEAGFTFVEMLAAAALLVMLALMLGTGLDMTVRSYHSITAQSELDLLMSTALDALADDLRFASSVVNADRAEKLADDYSEDCCNFNYTSDSFAGERFRLGLNGKGQIVVCDKNGQGDVRQFLSTGAYGAERADGTRAYKVEEMKIGYAEGIFTIELTVQSAANPSIKATGNITVRCLNP